MMKLKNKTKQNWKKNKYYKTSIFYQYAKASIFYQLKYWRVKLKKN
jgi:hypothetical protein